MRAWDATVKVGDPSDDFIVCLLYSCTSETAGLGRRLRAIRGLLMWTLRQLSSVSDS